MTETNALPTYNLTKMESLHSDVNDRYEQATQALSNFPALHPVQMQAFIIITIKQTLDDMMGIPLDVLIPSKNDSTTNVVQFDLAKKKKDE